MSSRPPLSSLISCIASRARIAIGWPSGSEPPHLYVNSAAFAGQCKIAGAATPMVLPASNVLRDNFMSVSLKAVLRRKGADAGKRLSRSDGWWRTMRNWFRVAETRKACGGTRMISKFTTVYAGHVDLPDRGQNTTPANERRYSNEHLASVFDKTDAIARKMDTLGYDTLWLAEHHFQHEGYECIPNILILAVHLAHVTKQIKIGCAFNIAPMWHPLRLAEDFATADILTGGRTIFGVGRGYHTREVETFGAPMLDQEANRELFEEQVEIIFKAFNEESFSHRGKYYTLPARVPYRGYDLEKLTLVPRPIHLPVETWQPIVSANPRGLDFMVKPGT